MAIVALAVSVAKIADENTVPGRGFSAVATVAADPTGPTGGPGGGMDGGMNGSQFQPPQMPNSMPDYQGGNNRPPLDQNSGISIYNSGNPQAPQQAPGQQGGQQPQRGWDQPAHGTQMPDYQTAAPYTQGPGKANPDYQAPQQQSPQQPQQQQPSQAPTQTQQPDQPQNKQDRDTQQLNDRERDQLQRCQNAQNQMQLAKMGLHLVSGGASLIGGLIKPSEDAGLVDCAGCDEYFKQKDVKDSRLSDSDRDKLCPAGYQFAGNLEMDYSPSSVPLFGSDDMTLAFNCGKVLKSSSGKPRLLKQKTADRIIKNACPTGTDEAVVSIGESILTQSAVMVGGEAGAEIPIKEIEATLKLNGSFTQTWSTTKTKTQSVTWKNPRDGFQYELVPLATETMVEVVRVVKKVSDRGIIRSLWDSDVNTTDVSKPIQIPVVTPEGSMDWVKVLDSKGNPVKANC